MRNLLVVIAASLLATSAAFAEPAPVGSDISEVNKPAAQTQPAPVVMPAPQRSAVPSEQPAPSAKTGEGFQTIEPDSVPDCKLVKIYRPDVGTHFNIVVHFMDLAHANAVDKIQKCNQNVPGSTFISIMPSSVGGFRVKFAAPGGWGTVNLPIGLTDGSADQLVCNIGDRMGNMGKFATQWSGALPDKIVLQKMDSFDEDAGRTACRIALEHLTGPERQSIGLSKNTN